VERARRAKNHLSKQEAHSNRKHKNVDYAFASRSISHACCLIQIEEQEKKGSRIENERSFRLLQRCHCDDLITNEFR
jgi:hypothetical protein